MLWKPFFLVKLLQISFFVCVAMWIEPRVSHIWGKLPLAPKSLFYMVYQNKLLNKKEKSSTYSTADEDVRKVHGSGDGAQLRKS